MIATISHRFFRKPHGGMKRAMLSVWSGPERMRVTHNGGIASHDSRSSSDIDHIPHCS